MKRISSAIYATVALSFLVGVSMPSAAQAAEPTVQTLEIYGGIIDENHPLNSEDQYTEVSTDLGVTWHPAYLVGGNHPWGNVAGTNSWLNCAPSFFDCLNVRSDYRYRFYLAPGWSASNLVADMKIDNYGWISLNGTDISGEQAGQWNSGGPIALEELTHTGWNELHVVLVDQGGWAGINFHLTYTVTSPEPIKVLEPRAPSTLAVDFNLEGGDGSVDPISYTLGAPALTLPAPTRDGFTFQGWAKDSLDGLIVDSEQYIPDAAVTLHAIWDKIPAIDDKGTTDDSTDIPVETTTSEQVKRTLAETGLDPMPISLLAFGLVLAGVLLIRKTKRS